MFGANDSCRISSGNKPGITLGLVSNVDDPENLGRIKVKMPAFGENYETDWAPVVVPMAGKEAGFFFIPNVGDEVVVMFKGGDLNYPYVIGSVWAKNKKPPRGSQDAKDNILVINSRKGHILVFDDEKGINVLSRWGHHLLLMEDGISVSDEKGKNFLKISAKGGSISLHAASKLELKASEISIVASAIKLEADTFKCDSITAQIAAKASLTSECSGIHRIKGSLVKIN
jgi:uncharacterized protein involved in type VI secretion and phage assembly